MEDIKEFNDSAVAKRLTMFRVTYIHKTQSAAAPLMGIPQTSLSNLEKNKYAIRADLIAKLAERFNLNPSWLTTGKGSPVLKAEEKKKTVALDLGELLLRVGYLEKTMESMTEMQKYLIEIIEGLDSRVESLEKKIE